MSVLIAASKNGGDHTKWSGKLSLFEQSPWDLSSLPARASEFAALTTMFDLFHVRSGSQYTVATHPTSVLNQSTLESELTSFKTGNYGTLQFVYHMITDLGPAVVSYTNDAHWTNIAANFAKMGAALVDEKPLITGIFWDWEYYGGSYWFASDASGLSGTLDQKATLVKSRFKQVMNGLLSTYPDVYFSVSHGSGNSTSASFEWMNSAGHNFAGNDVAWANPMMWAAFIGMQEAIWDAGNIATLFDGGEAYTPRTEDDVHWHALWQQVIARRNPQPSAGTWTSSMMTGFEDKYHIGANIGCYDRSPYSDNRDGVALFAQLSAASVQEIIKVNMRQNPSLTWFYTEGWDWVDRAWKADATTAIKDAVTEGRRLGRL